MADVIAISMWIDVITHILLYIVYMADVIANLFVMVYVEPHYGPVFVMADVIAIVADVFATILQIELYYNSSWCYYCFFFVIATYVFLVCWLMFLPWW